MRVGISTYNIVKGVKFWKQQTTDWSKECWSEIKISPFSKEFVDYEIILPQDTLKDFLKQIRIEPAVGAKSGDWTIKSIEIYGISAKDI